MAGGVGPELAGRDGGICKILLRPNIPIGGLGGFSGSLCRLSLKIIRGLGATKTLDVLARSLDETDRAAAPTFNEDGTRKALCVGRRFLCLTHDCNRPFHGLVDRAEKVECFASSVLAKGAFECFARLNCSRRLDGRICKGDGVRSGRRLVMADKPQCIPRVRGTEEQKQRKRKNMN